MNQYHTPPQLTPHNPSTKNPVPLRHFEANINDDAAATWDMTTTSDAKSNEIDRQGTHTVEGDTGNDKEEEERYVVWDGSGSL